jgi:hypothetical protein
MGKSKIYFGNGFKEYGRMGAEIAFSTGRFLPFTPSGAVL